MPNTDNIEQIDYNLVKDNHSPSITITIVIHSNVDDDIANLICVEIADLMNSFTLSKLDDGE